MTAGGLTREEAGLAFVTLVIGPESQGRGYRMLAPDTLSVAGARDLAMVLMEWSRTGEKMFAGCLRLPGPQENFVVFRARHLGRERLGEAAFINGALVTAEQVAALGHRTELLLPLIEPPDGSIDFAARPLTLTVPETPFEPKAWEGLGLAWRDRHIVTDSPEQREELLLQALASIDPPEQRPRVAAWVTSARLVSRGALDPLGQSQLIVGDAGAQEGMPGHLRCDVPNGRARGQQVAPPESWTTWLRFQDFVAATPRFAALRAALQWRPDYAPLRAGEIVEEALRIATGILPPDDMVEFLQPMLTSGEPFSRAAASVAADYVEALHAHGTAAATLHRLWAASEQSAALTRALLRFGGDPERLDLGAALEAARAAIRAGTLVEDGQARQGLVGLMKAAVTTLESRSMPVDILSEIIESWPVSSKTELFSLTSHGTFEIMGTKSTVLADKIARLILRRDFYGFGVWGEDSDVRLVEPVGWLETLRAIARMRAKPCPN